LKTPIKSISTTRRGSTAVGIPDCGLGAAGGKSLGNRTADAACGTGDDGHPSSKIDPVHRLICP
jgi:hypothetical protein